MCWLWCIFVIVGSPAVPQVYLLYDITRFALPIVFLFSEIPALCFKISWEKATRVEGREGRGKKALLPLPV